MKALAGLVAVLLVACVGAVAAYDYTVGGIGLLPASWKADAAQPTPCCHQAPACCSESASPVEEESCPACPACSACPSTAQALTAPACPYCPAAKAATEAESVPAPKVAAPAPND
jgi:hypothetical protein